MKDVTKTLVRVLHKHTYLCTDTHEGSQADAQTAAGKDRAPGLAPALGWSS